MVESGQQSQLEQKVSTIDALEVLLRVGNNQSPIIDVRNQRSIDAMNKVMHYLLEKDLVIDHRIEADTIDYATYATLTPKGREIYERIKQNAPNVFKGELFFIVNPPKYTSEQLFDSVKYELAPEEDHGEGTEVRYDTYFGKTKEEWEVIQAGINRTVEIDNALCSMVEGVYALFHEHPEFNPKIVLKKYREDFENITKKILQE